MPGSPRPVRRITRFLIKIKEEFAIIIKGAPRHPLIKPKIMKKQMYYFFNLVLIQES